LATSSVIFSHEKSLCPHDRQEFHIILVTCKVTESAGTHEQPLPWPRQWFQMSLIQIYPGFSYVNPRNNQIWLFLSNLEDAIITASVGFQKTMCASVPSGMLVPVTLTAQKEFMRALFHFAGWLGLLRGVSPNFRRFFCAMIPDEFTHHH
jgi:hypothetical protein